MIGVKFGRLSVIKYAGTKDSGGTATPYVSCKCECGTVFLSNAHHVRRGRVISCGCYRKGPWRNLRHGHGRSGKQTRVYNIWKNMHSRCNNPNAEFYYCYGGRGIKVCGRWSGRDGFQNFFDDMGEPPKGYSIERIEVNGDYEPRNCEWKNSHDQSRNKRNNVFVAFEGRRMVLTDAARLAGLDINIVCDRVKKLGWSMERALLTPRRKLSRK